MKINELLTEDQLDEISMGGIGHGIGKTASKVVGGVKDFWSGMKQGWKDPNSDYGNTTAPTGQAPAAAGQAPAAAGQATAPTAQATAPTAQATAPTAQAPAAAGQAPAAAGQAPNTLYTELKTAIDKLDTPGKQQVYAELQKLGGAPVTNKTATKKPAAGGAMNQMANTLTKAPTASSTGGTTVPTASGIKHTAKSNNPNKTIPTLEFKSKFLGMII